MKYPGSHPVAGFERRTSPLRVAALTLFALCAFAANSLLCRFALDGASIDASSFTSVRLLSGALTLWLILRLAAGRDAPARMAPRNWLPACMLFLYAIAFSFAYLSLTAGTGALILFGTVQATMILAGLWRGNRLRGTQWTGLLIALAGLAYLVSPGLSAPSPGGALLMTLAGIAWGVYSLQGRGVTDAIAATAANFSRSVPFALAVSVVLVAQFHISMRGIILAAISGSLASAIGYVAWYAALPGLTTTRAATVQLAVPLLAAIAAVLLLGEQVTPRLLAAGCAILGGIALTFAYAERIQS